MSVTSVKRLWTGRGGSSSLLRRRVYRETWEVLTNSVEDDEQTVTGAAAVLLGLPQIGYPHAKDPAAIVTDLEPDQSDDTPFIWYVRLTYDSQPEFPNATNPDGLKLDPANIPDNPLARPATWSIGSERTTEAATKWYPVDTGGTMADVPSLIRNSAKLPFDPPATIEKTRMVLRVSMNIPRVTAAYLIELEDAVNEKPWLGVPKWCAKVSGATANSKYEGGVSFVELVCEVSLNRDTWLLQLLDCGFNSLDERSQEDGTKLKTYTMLKDVNGDIPTSPLPLDGNGRLLAPNQDPVFLRGLPTNYHLEDFNVLLPFIKPVTR